jgi:hypothetical protein
MIIDTTRQVEALLTCFEANKGDPQKLRMRLAMEVVVLMDRGASQEQARCIEIIQRHGMNPMPVVEHIRKRRR